MGTVFPHSRFDAALAMPGALCHNEAMSDVSQFRAAIRDVPDFPKPGIVFKDITPVLADAKLFHESIAAFGDKLHGTGVEKIAAIDARGFIFGAALAYRLGVGFIPIRKKGKLPWRTQGAAYALEYGEATVEIHTDAVLRNEKVVLIDDVLATGGTAAAALELLRGSGADVVAVQFFVELGFLNGREKLPDTRIDSLVTF
jgi:adenine phosphoribosyltransferase